MSPRTSALIDGIGRSLITLGCLILAFAAFQLWGTGLNESRAQNALQSDFEQRSLAFAAFAEGVTADSTAPATTTTTPESTTPESTTPTTRPATTVAPIPAETVPPELLPAAGEALGVIRIPAIDVDKVVVVGTRRDDLRKGPGHYPTTPLPGQAGNAAVAGHRTTYGAPFGDIDLLEPGDQIEVETFQGTFHYEVLAQETADGTSGHAIVNPTDVYVLDDYGDNRLTLTACHPKYSARQRIVVQAQLVSPPAVRIELPLDDMAEPVLSEDQLAYEATGINPETGEIDGTSDPVTSALDEANVVGISDDVLDESLGWHTEEFTPFVLWALSTAVAAGIALLVARRWRRWAGYAVGSPVVLALLFMTFSHLDRMLPAF